MLSCHVRFPVTVSEPVPITVAPSTALEACMAAFKAVGLPEKVSVPAPPMVVVLAIVAPLSPTTVPLDAVRVPLPV